MSLVIAFQISSSGDFWDWLREAASPAWFDNVYYDGETQTGIRTFIADHNVRNRVFTTLERSYHIHVSTLITVKADRRATLTSAARQGQQVPAHSASEGGYPGM